MIRFPRTQFVVLALMSLGVAARSFAGPFDRPDILVAAENGSTSTARDAIARGDDPDIADDSAIAAQHGYREIVRVLLAGHARPNRADADGKTALLWAADQGDATILEILIKAGAKVDQATKTGVTPLMAAARKGNQEAVDTLLAAGADPHRTDFTGRDAVSWAQEAHSTGVIAALRKAGG
jgi:uncharacterized protein